MVELMPVEDVLAYYQAGIKILKSKTKNGAR